jgi:outer membrane protein OmpA-like peptidoglycan-associated protein
MNFRIILSLLLFIFFGKINGQSNLPPGAYTSTNKKAIKQLEEGKKLFEVKKDAEAEKHFLKAIELDPNFVEPHMALGYLYVDAGKPEQAIEHLKKATELNAKFFPNNFYSLSVLYISTGRYAEAKQSIETFLAFPRINPSLKDNAEKCLRIANFGIEAMKNPKPINPVNMGPEINSENFEYFPAITADGKTFLYTRNFRLENEGKAGQEDFYSSEKVNDKWQQSAPVNNINSPGNEGAPTISADGQFMFYASCPDMYGNYGAEDRKGEGSCDIFYAQKINGQWTKPVNVGPPVNTANWESQPSFSSDGKTLYFVRGIITREGIKYQDIYMSQVGSDGKFSEPVKLNKNINTDEKEESVYIHPDNMTLYFSSDGHPGMGQLDIFMSKRQADGEWGPAVNLGYPINTWGDENSWLVDPSGKIAYFASVRKDGYGGLDIYKFDLPAELQPELITYVKGKVYDINSKKPLEATFELIDLETQKQVVKSFSGKDGNFLVTLTANRNYLLNVSKNGYLYYSDHFNLKDVKADYNNPYKLDVPLQPIDTGYAIELKVFFDVDKFELKPESKPELDKLIAFLKANPSLRGELGGHTDNTGDKKKNQLLSQNRAKAVLDYLVTNGGIDKVRLTSKGFGDTRPKVPNDTPEHKQMNRRTEFKVKSK